MMTETSKPTYFPLTLLKALNAIVEQPLTLISAGSGFGKTTAVANRLERCPRDTRCRWYTCFGEPPERAWSGICRLIAFADAQTGERLSKTELPAVNHLGYIASLMEELSCEKETVLVVDNYQLAGFPAPYRLLDALAAHNCPRLHIVVLSHPIYADAALCPTNPRIRQITQDIFCFSVGDIQKLFSRHEVELSYEDAEKLTERTGGWVAALRLHLTGFLAGNSLMESAGLSDLLEQAFWRRLSERERNLFIGLSLLDYFTEAEAARLLGADSVRKTLYPVTTPFALIVTLRHLSRIAPSELIGTADAYIGESAAQHHFMPQLYFVLEKVAFYEREGQREQAVEKLRQILTLALPDQAYLPIAEYYGAIAPVLNDPTLECTDKTALERIHALGRRFVIGVAAIRAARSGISPLTPREREMALLAQGRRTTQEIAERLSVSPATVKNTLNKVYAKLEIKGKTELMDMQL